MHPNNHELSFQTLSPAQQVDLLRRHNLTLLRELARLEAENQSLVDENDALLRRIQQLAPRPGPETDDETLREQVRRLRLNAEAHQQEFERFKITLGRPDSPEQAREIRRFLTRRGFWNDLMTYLKFIGEGGDPSTYFRSEGPNG